MGLLDRHHSRLGGALRTLFKRERDRRRFAGSAFGWLFQPYLGEELVALAFSVSPQDSSVVSVAAVVFNPYRVHTQSAWVATLAKETPASQRVLHRHAALNCTALLPPTEENIATLAQFIGNRPVVGWQLGTALSPLNRLFNEYLGFELPNTQVDVAKLYQRRLHRARIETHTPPSFGEALARTRLPAPPWSSLLSEASANALLYMRLKRDAALEA